MLEQKSVEFCDQPFDEISHSIERFKNRLTTDNLRIAERYIRSEIDVIACFFIRTGRNVQEFCAVFNVEHAAKITEPNGRFLQPPSTQSTRDRENQPVLVFNVELMEIPERVIRSSVRLYVPQDLNCIGPAGVNLRYFSFAKGRVVLLQSLCDRELSVLVSGGPANIDQLPEQMVESASEVVDGISQDAGRFNRERIGMNDVIGHVVNMRLMLGSKSVEISTEKVRDKSLQVSDVLVGPFNFLPDSVRPIGHAV